jgi:hypothetical protein
MKRSRRECLHGDAAEALSKERRDVTGRVETLPVPREPYDEIVAKPDDWKAQRQDLSAGPFVDMHRLLVPQEKAAAEPAAAK